MAEESPAIKKTVVLVDDEPQVLFALKLLLGALGCRVIDFSSPQKAIEYLAGDGLCDFVLCDLKMPECDGIGVLQRLKELRPQTPFILMSGHATESDVARAEESGSAGFLPKPFSGDDIKSMLARL